MITWSDYFEFIVLPTVDDFRRDNKSARKAMLASMVISHSADYIAHGLIEDEKKADDKAKRLRKQFVNDSFAFKVVDAFAKASKHCRATGSIHSDSTMVTTPAYTGKAVPGRTFFGDTVGGVAVKWQENGYVNLTKAINQALKYLECINHESLKNEDFSKQDQPH